MATAAVFRSPQAQSSGPQTGEGDSNAIVCNCGQDALLLTVRKEGPNTGNTPCLNSCIETRDRYWYLIVDTIPNIDSKREISVVSKI